LGRVKIQKHGFGGEWVGREVGKEAAKKAGEEAVRSFEDF
jgi:hypothetical protein